MGRSKYGQGLGKEIYLAAINGVIPQPFSTSDIRKFCESNNWNPTESYINSLLPDSSSNTHSPNYKKYFKRTAYGQYEINI